MDFVFFLVTLSQDPWLLPWLPSSLDMNLREDTKGVNQGLIIPPFSQVAKQEKKKKKTGRAKRRMQYNRRFVNVVPTFGKKKGPNANS